jgi:hypothetical protein
VSLHTHQALDEVLYRLSKNFNRAAMRLIRLDPMGGETISAATRKGSGKLQAPDWVAPFHFAAALQGIRGQTAVVTGRIEAGVLRADAGTSGTIQIELSQLERAAADADVNLIVVGTNKLAQPSATGLFGPVRFKALEAAFQTRDLRGFLSAVGDGKTVRLRRASSGDKHVAIAAEPRTGPTSPAGVALGDAKKVEPSVSYCGRCGPRFWRATQIHTQQGG